MKNQTRFREYNLDQIFLLPPDMKQWLPEDHLAHFLIEVVAILELDDIYGDYNGALGGQPPYHPQMMVALLLYAYCIGMPSSRKIEKATYEQIAFRVLAANQHPDHDTIAEFRKRHLKALSGLFVQVLRLCQKAGLVKLGHVALDGTKVRANASKHKAMSYGRMEKTAVELEKEVDRLLKAAQQTDDKEDDKFGKGNRGDELPEELRNKQARLRKIKEAKHALETEAEERAEQQRPDYEAKKQAWENRTERRGGRPPVPPSEKPESKTQRNFTDSDSRIMKDGATKSFEQCYNAQAAVDETRQVIVATNLTQQPNDKQQVKPLVEKLKANTNGLTPKRTSADNGYYSEDNVEYLQNETIDPYLATGRLKHSELPQPAPRGRIPKNATVKERMARKLRTIKGRCTYSKRKHIVEPVFGQIKETRGFRRFSLRGLNNVKDEWDLICLTHNMLKLFRSGFNPIPA